MRFEIFTCLYPRNTGAMFVLVYREARFMHGSSHMYAVVVVYVVTQRKILYEEYLMRLSALQLSHRG